MADKKKVLFVCLGNIVRSPLAENMFNHLIDQAGITDQFEVDSAGTAGYHVGESPDSRMTQVAKHNGLIMKGRARQFVQEDFDRFDIIIGMDTSNRSNMLRLARSEKDRSKIHLMREFDPQGSSDDPVPDPYYGGMEGFTNVYEIVERSCKGLLDAIQNGELN